MELFELWGIGEAGKDNGLLLLFAEEQREVRFETGYGLEGDLPDSFLGRVIDEAIVPSMRASDVAGAIDAAISMVQSRLEGWEGQGPGDDEEWEGARGGGCGLHCLPDNCRGDHSRVQEEAARPRFRTEVRRRLPRAACPDAHPHHQGGRQGQRRMVRWRRGAEASVASAAAARAAEAPAESGKVAAARWGEAASSYASLLLNTCSQPACCTRAAMRFSSVVYRPVSSMRLK